MIKKESKVSKDIFGIVENSWIEVERFGRKYYFFYFFRAIDRYYSKYINFRFKLAQLDFNIKENTREKLNGIILYDFTYLIYLNY